MADGVLQLQGVRVIDERYKEYSKGAVAFTLLASGWSSAVYSFESLYPSTNYDISIEPNGDVITTAQLQACNKAQMVGSIGANSVKALGTVPTIDIPVILIYKEHAFRAPQWSTATDAQIAELLTKHYAGEINLAEHWNIGDTRKVQLSAMAATGVGESHDAQEVELQLVNAGGKELADGRECAFVVQVKDLLTNASDLLEDGYMNSTNTNVGGWKECARRGWCNNVFRNALPEATRNFFKLHKNKTSQGNQLTTLDETEDYFALPCTYNIFGTASQSWSGGSDEDPTHWSYYDTKEKRVKDKRGSSSAVGYYWWMRSPSRSNATDFCIVGNTGNLSTNTANARSPLAPFGCI